MTSLVAVLSSESFTDLTDEQKLEMTCNGASRYLSLYFLDDNLSDQGYIYICIVITLLLEGLSFAYIYNFKGLQAHPMKMYMWINMATFCFMWSKLALPFICNLNLPQILSFTTSRVILDEWQAMSVLLYSTLFLDTYFYNMMIAMNMCL